MYFLSDKTFLQYMFNVHVFYILKYLFLYVAELTWSRKVIAIFCKNYLQQMFPDSSAECKSNPNYLAKNFPYFITRNKWNSPFLLML